MHVVLLHARDAHFPAIIRVSRVYNPFLVVSFLFLQRRNNIYTMRFYRGCNHKDTWYSIIYNTWRLSLVEENYLDQLNYMKYTIVIFNLIKIRYFTYFPLLICHDMDDLKVPHSCHEYKMILYIYTVSIFSANNIARSMQHSNIYFLWRVYRFTLM